MTRAFIVKIDVEDAFALQDTADDIFDDLTGQGYLVESVAPWRGPHEVAPLVPSPIQAPPV